MIVVEVTLSKWLYNALQAHEVLTHSPRLFAVTEAAGTALVRACTQALWASNFGA